MKLISRIASLLFIPVLLTATIGFSADNELTDEDYYELLELIGDDYE